MNVDLFGAAEPESREPRMLSVSELTRAVRATLEDEIGVVWVEGEVSNYRRQPSGHQYFTLKDASAQVSCVWFAARSGLRLKQMTLADGLQVQVRGALTVYEARGQYQLNVQIVQAGGAGLLQAKFEALKRKLEAEGLFDAERKRPLPRFPATIGIVTSPTGAAVRDILNILARRAPWVRVVICPARVQGDGAAEEVATGIAEFERLAESGELSVDVILVGRGGGSVEDLWAFNEEVVARAIAASPIPVVSAVGHEIDFTIADFVADLRAPTPSAAAELLVPDGAALLQSMARCRAQLDRAVFTLIQAERQRLDFLTRSALFREPRARLLQETQRVDLAGEALRRVWREALGEMRAALAETLSRIRQHRPDQLLALRREQFRAVRNHLAEQYRRALADRRTRLNRLEEILRVISPEATLGRGYTITQRVDGTVVQSPADAPTNSVIVTRTREGEIRSKVLKAPKDGSVTE